MADGKADNSDSAKALEESRSLKAMLTEVYEEVFTIEYVKDLLLWLMDQANVKFSISVNKLVCYLFNEINLMLDYRCLPIFSLMTSL